MIENLELEVFTGENNIRTSLSHDEILTRLKSQCIKIDFQERVYPDCARIKKEIQELHGKIKSQTDIYEVEKIKAQITQQEKTLDEFKVKISHYLIITIEEILSMAKDNRWDMCINCGFVYLYNGAFWKAIDKEGLQKFFGEVAELIGVPKFEARIFSFRENLLKQFYATAHLPKPKRTRKSILINFKNGTLEIKGSNLTLRPFSAEDFITYQLPFDYKPEVTAPLWQKFLDDVLPDTERQNVLSEYMASTFLSNKILKLEKVLMLYGKGSNGKGVVFEVISSLFGEENISSYSLSQLTDEKGYHVAGIIDKLINYSSENGVKIDSNTFKQLASGEPVGARVIYGTPFQATEYAKLVFNTNMLPKDGVEQTDAFFRRFLIIPFDVTITEDRQDRELHLKIIANELPGVFNWVIEGLNRLLKQKGFSDCRAAVQKLDEYRTQSDTVRLFLREKGYEKSYKENKLLKELYDEYKLYCGDSLYKAASLREFSERLRNAKYDVQRMNMGNIVWIGVASVVSVDENNSLK